MDSKRVEHLKMLQAVITRMGTNSFQLKGWCVTLVSALLALGSKEGDRRLVVVAYYPVAMFWILDAYFLWQERLFRKLYDKVRTTKEEEIDFSMNHSEFRATTSLLKVACWGTIPVFYGTMVVAILIGLFILLRAA
jgi:hypothetical protein